MNEADGADQSAKAAGGERSAREPEDVDFVA
jgi:hypothetical protein